MARGAEEVDLPYEVHIPYQRTHSIREHILEMCGEHVLETRGAEEVHLCLCVVHILSREHILSENSF